MATLSFIIRPTCPTSEGKYPIYLKITAKGKKALIKMEYQVNDICQFCNGKVTSRVDPDSNQDLLHYNSTHLRWRAFPPPVRAFTNFATSPF